MVRRKILGSFRERGVCALVLELHTWEAIINNVGNHRTSINVKKVKKKKKNRNLFCSLMNAKVKPHKVQGRLGTSI